MNLTMNEIIEKDSELTEVVDEQISLCTHRQTVSVASAGIYQCLECGKSFEEGERI